MCSWFLTFVTQQYILVFVALLSVHHVPFSVDFVNLFGPVSVFSVAISPDIIVVVTVVTIVILASVFVVPVNVH